MWSGHFSSPGSPSSKRKAGCCVHCWRARAGTPFLPLTKYVALENLFTLSEPEFICCKMGNVWYLSHIVVVREKMRKCKKKCLAYSMQLQQMSVLPITMTLLYHKRDWHKTKSRTVRENIWKCSNKNEKFKYLHNVWNWVQFPCCGMS